MQQDVVIKADNLSKRYLLRTGFRIDSIRDFLPNLAAAMNPFQKKKEEEQSETFWALKNVSFEVRGGEILGLVGRNGAGKSTLLKILSRITEPTEGRALVRGRIGSLLEVGVGFHPELTGRENIFLSGAILGMRHREIRKKFDEIVEFANVGRFIDMPVKRYSSGMHVRLGFAVAAHLQQDILIVDEVLAVGDAAFQNQCLQKLSEIKSMGRTVLFVSHSIAALTSLCTEALYLQDGQVRAYGKPQEIAEQYLNEISNLHVGTTDRIRPKNQLYTGYRYGDAVRFEEISLESGSGSVLRFGESIPYLLTVVANQDIKDIQIGISVLDIQGICIGTIFQKRFFSMKNGETKNFRVVIEKPGLSPGSYSVKFILNHGMTQQLSEDLDLVHMQPGFQVVTNPNEGPSSWQLSWGRIIFNDVTVQEI